MNYQSYFGRILNAFSQFLHAVAGGHPDISMSAKIGWFAKNQSKWFKIVRLVVDNTFYLLEGEKGHCEKAYQKDKEEDYILGNNIWLKFIISILPIVGCFFLLIPFLIIFLIKKL